MTDSAVANVQSDDHTRRKLRRGEPVAATGLSAAFVALGVLVTLRWPPLLGADLTADLTVHPWVLRTQALLAATVAVTNVGSSLSVNVIIVLVSAALLIRRRARAVVYLVAARLLELALETATKHLVGRPRPVLPHPVAHAGSFSFPSGHTAGTAVLCASLLVLTLPVLRPRLRALWITLSALAVVAVAASRVLLGVHYPSDVLGGALLGTACALALTPLLPANLMMGDRSSRTRRGR